MEMFEIVHASLKMKAFENISHNRFRLFFRSKDIARMLLQRGHVW
jgi:hypothetical protein